MANKFMNTLKQDANFTHTENGALTHKSTGNGVLDLFAMGAAYRHRSDEDCVFLFKKAFEEDEVYALKCLFYLRDARGGQGERRFWRVCMKWLATNNIYAARRNIKYVPEFGRWDDLYIFVGTPVQNEAFNLIKKQLALDVDCKTPSLLAKWLKSENTSSKNSRSLGDITRKALGMSHKQYRKTLSILRKRINVLERLMSENRWDEIEFDKIPSRAGLIYKNAFARHDIEREQANAQTYANFAKDTNAKVNAKTLYPYECVHEAVKKMLRRDYWSWDRRNSSVTMDDTDRLMINKYWDNLTDYFNGSSLNALAVVDTSASMRANDASAPINVAISLGMYCADKAKGPFAHNYVSFSRTPRLVEVNGVDFCDKVARIYETNLCENTNIEATFDMLLNTALKSHCSQADLPQNLIVISDMEFDRARGHSFYGSNFNEGACCTLMENIEKKWNAHGYKMPHLIYWNVDARQDNIPMKVKAGVSFVSGMSPSIFQQIMTGKTAYDLMYEVLDSERYACIK